MEPKPFFNETAYQKTKRKIIILAVIVLFAGILGGSLLIAAGISRSSGIDTNAVKAQRDEEFHANGFSYRYYELSDLLDKSESASVFYLAGGFIIIAACMGGASIYKFAMRREIAAFKAQQVIPVAKEGMEALAPAAGTAAKEIAKGVREGLNGREE